MRKGKFWKPAVPIINSWEKISHFWLKALGYLIWFLIKYNENFNRSKCYSFPLVFDWNFSNACLKKYRVPSVNKLKRKHHLVYCVTYRMEQSFLGMWISHRYTICQKKKSRLLRSKYEGEFGSLLRHDWVKRNHCILMTVIISLSRWIILICKLISFLTSCLIYI